ncbi:hypothetical protein [Pacificibacter maritimus]|nr:hypothetical protein [Pacificibacter maritimus]
MTLSAGDVSVRFNPLVGAISAVHMAGQSILHQAHWVGTALADCADAPVDAHLSGDFFCAPFGGSGLSDIPPHGWPANTPWSITHTSETPQAAQLSAKLQRDVFGARLTKTVQLISGHSAVYQTHHISGGQGHLTFAHHPMVHVAQGCHIGFSRKLCAITPDNPLEPQHRLAYPARSTDLARFPSKDGGNVDLHHYPFQDADEVTAQKAQGHEDFVTLVEAPEAAIGWTAVTRRAEKDIVIFLKDPKVAPVTMLWHSNGGRAYAPWNGQHKSVLGVEDGCCAGASTLADAAKDNAIARENIATHIHLAPTKTTVMRHAILRVARPEHWQSVADIVPSGDSLRLISGDGAQLDVAFDCGFFPHSSSR